jgi:hypothetical protein
MADFSPPIEVSSNTLPIASAIRYLIVTVGSFAVGRGWVAADQLPGIATAIVTIGTAAFGLYQNFRTKQKLVVTAEAAPNSVAKVVS